MKKILMICCVIGMVLSSHGCAAVLIGAGVAGGVAISEDTAKLDADASYSRAWKATYDTLTDMGTIDAQDKDSGKIDATIQGAKVDARVVPLTSKTVRIQIKARKNLLPNMDLAMMIINRINNKF